MDTNDRNREPRQRQNPAQPRQNQQRSGQPRKTASQPQSAAQRRAVQHQQAQRKAAAQQQPAEKRRPAATGAKKKTAKKQSLFSGLKLPKLSKNTNNSARDKRQEAARAAKLKAMKQEVSQTNRRRVSKPKSPAQPIVYTAPVPFNAHKLVMQLVSITAVVLAVVIGLSVFFKIERIEVSGAEVYDEWAVRQASGLEEGDNLMTFSRARAAGKIKAELMYVDDVRFGIKLPNTVIIDIVEFDVVYAVKASDGTWYLINSDGKIMEQTDAGTAAGYTKILGVTLSGPIVGEQARAAEAIVAAPESTTAPEDPTEETTPVVMITNQSRLDTAMRVLRSMELNGIIGEAASVNVSDLGHIELWYGTKYQVNLGDINNMDYKIACMVAAIEDPRMKNSMGELDISFEIKKAEVIYTPFQ